MKVLIWIIISVVLYLVNGFVVSMFLYWLKGKDWMDYRPPPRQGFFDGEVSRKFTVFFWNPFIGLWLLVYYLFALPFRAAKWAGTLSRQSREMREQGVRDERDRQQVVSAVESPVEDFGNYRTGQYLDEPVSSPTATDGQKTL